MITYKVEKHPQGLDALALRVNLDESLDMNCEWVVARNGDIAGAAGVNFDKEVYPRFEHIIVDPKYQMGSLGGRLMFKMEEFIRDSGYYTYISFIFKDNLRMINYALKFGFKLYGKGIKGDWYYKSLGRN